MRTTNPRVDGYFRNCQQWPKELKALRAIALDCQLDEELKWGKPCYTFQDSNVVILQAFKPFCAIMFFKGALLKDPHGVLEKPGENTQSARRIPFTSVQDVVELAPVLKAYIAESIEVEKAGLNVELKTPDEFAIPDEFQDRLAEAPALRTAFDALTPGRQRAYLLYFADAKQSKTRKARVEKCVPKILAGKGRSDR